MKLLLLFAAILAFSLAEEEKKPEALDDSQAEASATIELMKEGVDLNAAASTYTSYVPPSQRPPHWTQPGYVPQNTWQPPKPIQSVQTGVPANVQADYYPSNWGTPVTHPPTTTTPVPVILNEQFYGDNGYYKYEYKIADGTWVGEEGYYTDPKQTEESLVKRGWYSYVGADKKTYTVSYYADKTGYHAYGDHLPTPPPATQPDPVKPQKPQYDEYPTQTPAPVQYPTQTVPPVFKPTYTPEPIYYPTKAPVAPPVPAYPQLPTYKPPQQPFYPPQQPSFPPQQPSFPPQQPSYPPQQPYYPPQQNYYPQQPNNQV
ncbi:hypothetical protein PYW08_002729 [Mythimna loreyi]|uniref:Uncharacterized protein n=1 Tax=Mythimna loreyi TaxID=667449 RepID=A0ACC2QJX1_9NEOP|nr:hypothetical protein PYW08_002729 [Mythimna loreyi]